MKRLLVIDNFDSFTFNLVQMFRTKGVETIIKRNNEININEAHMLDPSHLLISPGPKTPADSGCSIDMIEFFHNKIPVLGVCLGMQCIAEFFGGKTIRAALPVHGKTSLVFHNKKDLFESIPTPFKAARYHSLIVEPCNETTEITAKTEDGVIMGIKHKNLPVFGVQFHPESFMTEYGDILIDNFLNTGKKS